MKDKIYIKDSENNVFLVLSFVQKHYDTHVVCLNEETGKFYTFDINSITYVEKDKRY